MPDRFKIGQDLPEVALPAWKTYCAMVTSKENHFRYLDALEQKYQTGGSRTASEITRLDNLLKEHDRCVGEFSTAMKTLANDDSMARSVLIEIIATLNFQLGANNVSAR